MEVKTEDDYKKAKEDVVNYKHWIQISTNKIEQLLDAIENERKTIKLYQSGIDAANKEITKYQVKVDVLNKIKA